ncbi:hypothetical protein [Macrococcoides caseolyticum]|uniref:hypothetical protein n=1 Tax=Macrococcoides caseolyticum TaxID=69966 RepID=UPI001F1C93D7|nr:hypothetical protein [Macrococcus caseolyticus]MCE4955988.1 hypothetical protein [Macrococcus caseolyticus]
MPWFEAIVSMMLALAPIIIVFLIFMDGYKTRVNSEKIIKQNEEMIEILKEINLNKQT